MTYQMTSLEKEQAKMLNIQDRKYKKLHTEIIQSSDIPSSCTPAKKESPDEGSSQLNTKDKSCTIRNFCDMTTCQGCRKFWSK